MHPPHVRRLLVGLAIVYVSWLAFLSIHELGHILHATVSGGRVISVRVPLWGFSQTIVHPNPHSLFVVWGGPLWGVLIPLIVCGMFRLARRRIPDVWRFFTGLCLIGNGAYIGIGWRVGGAGTNDAKDLLQLGTSPWVMIAFGATCVVGGLYCWHRTPSLSRRGVA